MKIQHPFIARARVLKKKDGRIYQLIVQRPPNKSFPLTWTAPGGKSEPGETPLETAKRELFEEMGIKGLRPDAKITVKESVYSASFGRKVPVYTITFNSFKGEIKPNSEIHDWGWLLLNSV